MTLFIRNRNKLTSLFVGLSASILLSAYPTWSYARLPKFGPYATPITEQTEYLRQKPAYDYWKLSQFYMPQKTSSACGLASVAMALNFLLGVPRFSDQTLISQPALLETVFTGIWGKKVAEGGDGLKFYELVNLVNKGLNFYKLKNYTVKVYRFENTAASLAVVKRILTENENSPNDLILVYYNQGVLTSDWDGPHISPIGAYDSVKEEVLLEDVDRDWYVPYWSPVEKLLEAMLRPAPIDQGILAGQTGGILYITHK